MLLCATQHSTLTFFRAHNNVLLVQHNMFSTAKRSHTVTMCCFGSEERRQLRRNRALCVLHRPRNVRHDLVMPRHPGCVNCQRLPCCCTLS